MKRIIFVSNVIALGEQASSTDIMTYNLVYGLKKNNIEVIMVVLQNLSDKSDSSMIKKYYETITDKFYIVKFNLNNGKNKFAHFKGLLSLYFNQNRYRNDLINISDDINDTVLVSHSPSLESVCYCRELKRKYPDIKYVEYWSDPVALSGITPEAFNWKRTPFYWIEKKFFSYADAVIFGTKPLLDAQKKLYSKYVSKMDYIDASYSEYDELDSEVKECKKNNNFLYSGNYYSNIRNISCLFDAVMELGGSVKLDVYGNGDVEAPAVDYIKCHGRVSPDKMKKIDAEYSNAVCLLNHSCIQIPGKIFYDMNSNKKILVITDGKNISEQEKYLREFNRFHIVNNDKNAIKNALIQMQNEPVPDIEYIKEKYSPKAIGKQLIDKIDNL